jgi:acetyl-CoA synthetase
MCEGERRLSRPPQNAAAPWLPHSIPSRFNIASEVCDRHAMLAPDSPAVIEHQPGGQVVRYSYAALHEQSTRLAGGLWELGVRPRDRVAVILPQGFLALSAHLAVQRLGGICVPISGTFAGRALRHRLADSAASVAFCDDSTVAAIRAVDRPATLRHVVGPAGLGDLDIDGVLAAGPPLVSAIEVHRDDPAFIFYTSGTTSTAKGVTLAARLLFALLPGFRSVFDLAPRLDDVFWTPSDWAWLGALGEVVLAAAYFGCPIVASPGRFSAARSYEIMSANTVTCAFLAPVVLRRMRQSPPPTWMRFALRAIMTGGERFTGEIRRFVEDSFGASLNDDYGLTESTHLAVGCAATFRTPPGAVGRALPDREIAVLADGEDEPVSSGQLGEIAVAAADPIVMLGYWNAGDVDRSPVESRWFRTGDLGTIDADGFLWFERRIGDVLKVSGIRVAAEEIEIALAGHLDVAEAGVTSLVDDRGETVIAAFVVIRSDRAPDDVLAGELRDVVRRELSAVACPRIVRFVDALPLTSTGKVDRNRLRERHGSPAASQGAASEPAMPPAGPEGMS